MAALALAGFVDGAIVKAISAAAPLAGDALMKKYCPELVKNLDTVMEAQKQSEARVKATINSTMLFQMTQPILDDIKHWSKQVTPSLERTKLGDPSDLLQLRERVREHIPQHLDTLHMHLLGNAERPGAQAGIIVQYMHDNYAKLKDEKNWGYHIGDYVLEVESMIRYYMSAQGAAFALRVMFIDDIDIKLGSVAKWEAELIANLKAQAALAFKTYPPFIRKIMSAPTLGARPVEGKHYRFLRQPSPPQRYLSYRDPSGWYWVTGHEENNGNSSASVWRFSSFLSGDSSDGAVTVWNVETGEATHWIYPPESHAEAAARMKEGTFGHGISARSRAYGRGDPIVWKIVPTLEGDVPSFKFVIEEGLLPWGSEYVPKLLQDPMLADMWVLEEA